MKLKEKLYPVNPCACPERSRRAPCGKGFGFALHSMTKANK